MWSHSTIYGGHLKPDKVSFSSSSDVVCQPVECQNVLCTLTFRPKGEEIKTKSTKTSQQRENWQAFNNISTNNGFKMTECDSEIKSYFQ